jgi:predicted nucleic acid-binding protein
VSKYIVDTQLLIRAFRSDAESRRLLEFLAAYSPSVYLSSVVVQELLAGARPGEMRRVKHIFIHRFERARRVVTPTHRSWTRGGNILRSLRSAGYAITPSLTNDVLIAASAVQIGATIIQDNEKDYTVIQRAFPPVSFTPAWPPATGR